MTGVDRSSSELRIGIVKLYYGPSGRVGFYNNQDIGLARALRRMGYNCFIFYPVKRGTQRSVDVIEDGITIVRCPAHTIGVHSRYDFGVLRDFKIDVAQICCDNQMFGPEALRLCDRLGIPACCYIGTLNSDSRSYTKSFLMSIQRMRVAHALRERRCFAKNMGVVSQLDRLGVANIELAPVGLDMSIIPDITTDGDDLRRQLSLPLDKVLLLFVGRLEEYKRPLDMIELIERMDGSYHAVLVGEGSLRGELEERVRLRLLSDKVTLLPEQPNADIHKYYAAADYFLNFNTGEIFGMSILEALYQGATVIAVRAPGPDMILGEGGCGYLVDGLDQMLEIIESRKHVDGDIARSRVVDCFSWDSTAGKLDAWIQSNASSAI